MAQAPGNPDPQIMARMMAAASAAQNAPAGAPAEVLKNAAASTARAREGNRVWGWFKGVERAVAGRNGVASQSSQGTTAAEGEGFDKFMQKLRTMAKDGTTGAYTHDFIRVMFTDQFINAVETGCDLPKEIDDPLKYKPRMAKVREKLAAKLRARTIGEPDGDELDILISTAVGQPRPMEGQDETTVQPSRWGYWNQQATGVQRPDEAFFSCLELAATGKDESKPGEYMVSVLKTLVSRTSTADKENQPLMKGKPSLASRELFDRYAQRLHERAVVDLEDKFADGMAMAYGTPANQMVPGIGDPGRGKAPAVVVGRQERHDNLLEAEKGAFQDVLRTTLVHAEAKAETETARNQHDDASTPRKAAQDAIVAVKPRCKMNFDNLEFGLTKVVDQESERTAREEKTVLDENTSESYARTMVFVTDALATEASYEANELYRTSGPGTAPVLLTAVEAKWHTKRAAENDAREAWLQELHESNPDQTKIDDAKKAYDDARQERQLAVTPLLNRSSTSTLIRSIEQLDQVQDARDEDEVRIAERDDSQYQPDALQRIEAAEADRREAFNKRAADVWPAFSEARTNEAKMILTSNDPTQVNTVLLSQLEIDLYIAIAEENATRGQLAEKLVAETVAEENCKATTNTHEKATAARKRFQKALMTEAPDLRAAILGFSAALHDHNLKQYELAKAGSDPKSADNAALAGATIGLQAALAARRARETSDVPGLGLNQLRLLNRVDPMDVDPDPELGVSGRTSNLEYYLRLERAELARLQAYAEAQAAVGKIKAKSKSQKEINAAEAVADEAKQAYEKTREARQTFQEDLTGIRPGLGQDKVFESTDQLHEVFAQTVLGDNPQAKDCKKAWRLLEEATAARNSTLNGLASKEEETTRRAVAHAVEIFRSTLTTTQPEPNVAPGAVKESAAPKSAQETTPKTAPMTRLVGRVSAAFDDQMFSNPHVAGLLSAADAIIAEHAENGLFKAPAHTRTPTAVAAYHERLKALGEQGAQAVATGMIPKQVGQDIVSSVFAGLMEHYSVATTTQTEAVLDDASKMIAAHKSLFAVAPGPGGNKPDSAALGQYESGLKAFATAITDPANAVPQEAQEGLVEIAKALADHLHEFDRDPDHTRPLNTAMLEADLAAVRNRYVPDAAALRKQVSRMRASYVPTAKLVAQRVLLDAEATRRMGAREGELDPATCIEVSNEWRAIEKETRPGRTRGMNAFAAWAYRQRQNAYAAFPVHFGVTGRWRDQHNRVRPRLRLSEFRLGGTWPEGKAAKFWTAVVGSTVHPIGPAGLPFHLMAAVVASLGGAYRAARKWVFSRAAWRADPDLKVRPVIRATAFSATAATLAAVAAATVINLWDYALGKDANFTWGRAMTAQVLRAPWKWVYPASFDDDLIPRGSTAEERRYGERVFVYDQESVQNIPEQLANQPDSYFTIFLGISATKADGSRDTKREQRVITALRQNPGLLEFMDAHTRGTYVRSQSQRGWKAYSLAEAETGMRARAAQEAEARRSAERAKQPPAKAPTKGGAKSQSPTKGGAPAKAAEESAPEPTPQPTSRPAPTGGATASIKGRYVIPVTCVQAADGTKGCSTIHAPQRYVDGPLIPRSSGMRFRSELFAKRGGQFADTGLRFAEYVLERAGEFNTSPDALIRRPSFLSELEAQGFLVSRRLRNRMSVLGLESSANAQFLGVNPDLLGRFRTLVTLGASDRYLEDGRIKGQRTGDMFVGEMRGMARERVKGQFPGMSKAQVDEEVATTTLPSADATAIWDKAMATYGRTTSDASGPLVRDATGDLHYMHVAKTFTEGSWAGRFSKTSLKTLAEHGAIREFLVSLDGLNYYVPREKGDDLVAFLRDKCHAAGKASPPVPEADALKEYLPGGTKAARMQDDGYYSTHAGDIHGTDDTKTSGQFKTLTPEEFESFVGDNVRSYSLASLLRSRVEAKVVPAQVDEAYKQLKTAVFEYLTSLPEGASVECGLKMDGAQLGCAHARSGPEIKQMHEKVLEPALEGILAKNPGWRKAEGGRTGGHRKVGSKAAPGKRTPGPTPSPAARPGAKRTSLTGGRRPRTTHPKYYQARYRKRE